MRRRLPRPFAGGHARGRGGSGSSTPAEWLIVGLGNPGPEYARTRHNVGFMVADALAARWELRRGRPRFRAQLAEGRVPVAPAAAGATPAVRRVPVVVVWPQTYMNEAGCAVGPARGAYRLPLERVVVVHDELDLPFADIRVRCGGGLAGHNGLRSLRRELGGADFWRVRVGIGRPDSTDPEIVSAHVLGRFREPPEEVRGLVQRAADAVERLVAEQGGANVA